MNIIKGNSPFLEKSLIDLIFADFKDKGVKDFLLPAGGTPEAFYEYLEKHGEVDLSPFSFWQIDDVLTGREKDCFKKFFREKLGKLYPQLNLIQDKFLGFEKPFSSFLGLGVNGHVAFHEPHIPRNFSFGCVELGQETLNYLKLEKGTWGITYGLGTFLKSESIYLMVKGSHKKDILVRFLENDKTVPAVALKEHSNLNLLLDDELYELASGITA